MNIDTFGRVIVSGSAEEESVLKQNVIKTTGEIQSRKNNLTVAFNLAGMQFYAIVPKSKFEGFTQTELDGLSQKGGMVGVDVPIEETGPGYIVKAYKVSGAKY